MLTSLHLRGEVAVAGRLGGQRLWDLAERVLPETEALPLRDAERALEERHFRALGVRRTRPGWEAHADATDGDVPDRVTLLSPFDRLVHDRDRAEALFGFHYRLEMFVPRAKREYGYYVLPILRGAELGRAHRAGLRPTPLGTRGERRVGAARRSSRRGARDPRGARADSLRGWARSPWRRPAGAAALGGCVARVKAPRRGFERVLGTWPLAASGRLLTRFDRDAAKATSRALSGHYDPPMHFETRAIHAGQAPDPATGAVTTPIYQTSTFAQEAVGVNKGYDYARGANPTRTALEECLASLENAEHGHAFSSGIGATATIMHLLDPATTSSASTTCTAGRTGCSRRSTSRRATGSRTRRPTSSRPTPTRTWPTRGSSGSRRRPTRCSTSSTSRRSPPPRRPRTRSSSSTTPSRRRTSRRRSTSAPTSSSTRRRSTSAATRTSSAASRRRTTRRSPSACGFSRSRSVRCPARSTPGSSCAA